MAKRASIKSSGLIDPTEQNRINRSVAVNYCSFAATVVVVLFIGFLLSFVKTQVDYEAIAQAYFYSGIEALTSQLARTLQYMVCSVGFVLLYALFYYLINRLIKENTASRRLNTIVHAVSLALLAALAAYLFYRSESKFLLALSQSVFNGFFSILLVVAGFLLTIYLALNRFSVGVEKFGGIVAMVACIIFILAVAYVHIVNSFYQENSGEYFHCEVVFHSIHQLYSGHTPLVDFRSTYGLFVYLYLPLELLLGGVTMENTSIVSSFFMLISMLCLMYCAFRLCKNKVIAAVTTIAMISISIMGISASWFGDPAIMYLYWQYTPIRILFPSIILALCCAVLYKRRRWVNFLRYALLGIALWTNLETGIACAATSVALDAYLLLVDYKPCERPFWSGLGKSLVKVLLSIAAATALVCVITLARSGCLPDFAGLVTDHMRYLSTGGYYPTAIDFLEIWILAVIVYALLLARGLRRMAMLRADGARPESLSAMYLVTAFMGVCLFIYYVGRDSCISLMHCSYPAVLGVGMLAQEYYGRISDCFGGQRKKRKPLRGNGLNLIKLLTCLACLFVAAAFSVALLVNPNYFVNGKKKPQTNPNTPLAASLQFLNEHYDAQCDGKIDIFVHNASTLYAELGMKNHMTFPQLTEWYYSYEIFREAEVYLSNTENYILIDRPFLENYFGQYTEKAYPMGITDNPDFVNWLQYERCEIIAQNERYLLLKPITE